MLPSRDTPEQRIAAEAADAIRMREAGLLERAERRLRRLRARVAGDARHEVLADIELAETIRVAGRAEEAIELALDAEARARNCGPDQVAAARLVSGLALLDCGRFGPAERTLTFVWERMLPTVGEDRRARQAALALGRARLALDRPSSACEPLLAAYKGEMAVIGYCDDNLLRAIDLELFEALGRSGETALALACARRAFLRHLDRPGADGKELWSRLNRQLARACRWGAGEQALQLWEALEEHFARAERPTPRPDPQLAALERRVGRVLSAARHGGSRLLRASAQCRAMLPEVYLRLGPTAAKDLAAEVADLLDQAGHSPRGLAIMRRCLSLLRSKLLSEPRDPDGLQVVLSMTASYYLHCGMPEQAELVSRESVERARRDPFSVDYPYELRSHARYLREIGEHDEAVATLREAVDAATQSGTDRCRDSTRLTLAETLAADGRREEALAVLREGGVAEYSPTATVLVLAKCGMLADAAAVRRGIRDTLPEKDATPESTRDHLVALARCDLALGRAGSAERLLRLARTIGRLAPRERPLERAYADGLLGEALLGEGKAKAAVRVLERAVAVQRRARFRSARWRREAEALLTESRRAAEPQRDFGIQLRLRGV